jgi:MFS family permease
VLRDGSSRHFLSATSLATVATFLQSAALGKYIYDLTDSEFLLGVLGLVEFAPALILLPLTGSAADRFDRRRIAAIGLGIEVMTAIFYLVYVGSEPTSSLPIFLIAAVFGVARAFVSPATRSTPPLVAPEGGMPRLMAIYAASWQAGLIIGPASSGLLYDRDPALPFAASAVCFGGASLLFLTLTTRRAQVRTSAGERTTFHHALEGLRFIRHRPVLFGAIALDMFAVLFGGAVALLPAIAEDRLGVGDVGYGWLRAAPGIGAIIFATAMAVHPIRRHVGHRLLLVVAIFGMATIVLGLTRNYVVAFVALMVLAGADSISVFIRTTIVPLATPDEMRGRVSAVENVFVGASNEVGAFESGVTAALFGVGPAVVLGGVLTLGVVGAWTVLFPDLRDIDRFEDVVEEPVSPVPRSLSA